MEEMSKSTIEENINSDNAINNTINENGITQKPYFFQREESVVEEIPETHVLRAIEKKLGTNHFLLLRYELKPLTERLGLLGDHSILHVSYLNDQGTKEFLTFFVKFFPKMEAPAQFAERIGAFKKEMFVYKLFKEFKKEGIALIDYVVPECYVSAINQYLIMDNLCTDSFMCVDKHVSLDYDSVLVVLQALAKLHASSIIFESKIKTTLLDLHSENLEESFYSDKPDFANLKGVDTSIQCTLDCIKLFNFPTILKSGKLFKDVAKDILYKVYDLVKPSTKYRNVLTHGDIWISNLLLKHDEKSKKPISCKLVDFQAARYVPPAQDVLQFLYLTTSKAFRKQYLYEVIGMYYSYLEKCLKCAGLDINVVLPFARFMESCEERKLFAIILATFYFPLILINNDEIEKILSNKELNEKCLFENKIQLVLSHKDKDPNYQVRIKESIEDLHDYCENYGRVDN